MTGVLYFSYDGILEPLGESQVVSYLERLAVDHAITLLTFEKPADLADVDRVRAMEHRLRACSIVWIRLRYHKRPPVLSTGFDVIVGIVRGRRLCRQRAIHVLHARSYVAALIALGVRRRHRAAFLFDMRGFWVDEKVEAGHWVSGGVLYRVGKWWERRFLQTSDAVVSLTEAGVRALPGLGYQLPPSVPVEVIPTCVDLVRFTPGAKDRALVDALGLAGSPVIGCVGTMSNWYMRNDMLQYLAALTASIEHARILVVSREDHVALRHDAIAAGIPPEHLVITRAAFDEMPRFSRLFDAGVFFIRPTLSKRGSAATKFAEFLACGVPVIINDGVGDSGKVVRHGRVGVVLPVLNEQSFAESIPEVRAMLADADIAARCRGVAAELFDIERGVERYRSLYRRVSAAAVGPTRGSS